jgi:hypothetical protein
MSSVSTPANLWLYASMAREISRHVEQPSVAERCKLFTVVFRHCDEAVSDSSKSSERFCRFLQFLQGETICVM